METKTYKDMIDIYKAVLDIDDTNAELVLSYILNTPIYKLDKETPIDYNTEISLLQYLYEALEQTLKSASVTE